MLFKWQEVGNVPSEPGVYAWYYELTITRYDINRVIEQVSYYKDAGDFSKAKSAISQFLHKFIFQYFTEEPYSTLISGLLKPKYEGELEHTPETSDSLISRIVEDPERLYTIKEILSGSVPTFASPMYIGMSSDLQRRISTHKKLITKFRAKESVNFGSKRDQSFALRVAERKLIPTRLCVAVKEISDNAPGYVDAENILNRINFPILGRN